MKSGQIHRRAFAGWLAGALAGCARSAPKPAAPPLATRPPAPLHLHATRPVEEAPKKRLALFDAFPAIEQRTPHASSIATLPTPVEHLRALGDRVGLEALYVKRDEESGALYGGGKTRKLVFLLGEALAQRATTVVTFGGVGSNHAIATTLYARALGLRTRLFLLPEPASEHVRQNLLLIHQSGAEMTLVSSSARATRAQAGAYVIAAGGSSEIGNLGFVDAAFELKAQVDQGELPAPDDVYIAMGTMGAAVGLAIGLRAAGLSTRVVAVRASSPGTSSEPRMRALFDSTVKHLRQLDASFPALAFERSGLVVEGGYLGAGYARETAKGARARALSGDHARLLLEPTYTAKAMAALLDRARNEPKRVALFWQTHNARPLEAISARPDDLPRELRGYFR